MLLPRLRKSVLTISVIPSNSIAAQFCASFHKGNEKFSFTVKGRQDKVPSKSQIRLTIRQKRADTKRALEDFLAKNGSSKHSFMEEESRLKWKAGLEDDSDTFHAKRRPKCSARNPKKPHQKKNKRKRKKDSFYECFDDRPDRTFSFRYKSFFEKEESDWGESVNSERMSSKTWGSSSESDSDSEFESDNGSLAERTLLGLPLSGPLKLEDLKKAFHASALKWHPDKHQGPSQAMGEEKFKQCVDAYKSLCKLVSTS